MKIQMPKNDLSFLTGIWVIYTALIFWWIDIPSGQLSWLGILLTAGVIGSVGIWLGMKPAGYVFAGANVVASILGLLLLLGFFVPDRPFSIKSITMTIVPLYCAFVAVRWARETPKPISPNAG